VRYCTAKVDSQGCLPEIGFTGSPSISGPDDFHVTATNLLSRRVGVLMWSLFEDEIAGGWGGTWCLGMAKPAWIVFSFGNQTPDCSGHLDYHFSQAYMSAHTLGAGMTLHVQFIYHDPLAVPYHRGLTDALRFTICP